MSAHKGRLSLWPDAGEAVELDSPDRLLQEMVGAELDIATCIIFVKTGNKDLLPNGSAGYYQAEALK